jgi:hypothetical protein
VFLLKQCRLELVEDKKVAMTELLHQAHQGCRFLLKSDKIAGFLTRNRLVCCERGPDFVDSEATRMLASYSRVCVIAVSMACVRRKRMRDLVNSCIAIELTSGVARRGSTRHGVDCSVHLAATRTVAGWHTRSSRRSWRRRSRWWWWWSTNKERLMGGKLLTA